ncbi:response regulator [Salinibacter ruber]|uniref:response regulator n=1 Tax=Salinibacter ruber TaxID=146919 RepID=UPI0018318D2B|nr:CheY-like chemotaxis protein [Salinibacter ruber]
MSSENRPTVLFVDDNQEARFLLGKMLEGTCEVVSTGSAEEALEVLSKRFSEEAPDLFLMDIRLPGGRSGAELLHLLQDFGLVEEVPAVALTTYAGPGDREALLEEGFDEYVSKPFRREELIGAIDRVLGSALPREPPLSEGPQVKGFPRRLEVPRLGGHRLSYCARSSCCARPLRHPSGQFMSPRDLPIIKTC